MFEMYLTGLSNYLSLVFIPKLSKLSIVQKIPLNAPFELAQVEGKLFIFSKLSEGVNTLVA